MEPLPAENPAGLPGGLSPPTGFPRGGTACHTHWDTPSHTPVTLGHSLSHACHTRLSHTLGPPPPCPRCLRRPWEGLLPRRRWPPWAGAVGHGSSGSEGGAWDSGSHRARRPPRPRGPCRPAARTRFRMCRRPREGERWPRALLLRPSRALRETARAERPRVHTVVAFAPSPSADA